jgi:hypothetical protein
MVRSVLTVALCLVLAVPVRAQTGTLEVRVTAAAGVPVPQALLTVRTLPDSAIARFADSDRDGRARFEALAAGRYEVSASTLGFQRVSRTVSVAEGATTRLDLVLAETAVTLPGVVVEAERRRARFEETAGRTTAEITQRDLKLLPAAGEADVLRAIAVLPGVVTTSDFSSAFNVRGGSADQNLILLDGFPIFNPFHLGGLFSVFNSDMVARAELLSGGFPAQYGGRVSSVVTVESDPGDPGLGVQAGLSLLAGRMAVGADLPAAPLAAVGLYDGRARVSARRSYFDQLLRPLFDFPYHLTDLQLFGEAWSGAGGRLTVTGYTGRDVLDLTGSEAFPLRVHWDWGNDVAGVGWTQILGGQMALDVRSGHSRFSTAIRFPEFDDTEFRSRIDQTLLRVDLTVRSQAELSLGAGLGLDRLHYENLARSGGTVFGGGNARGWLGAGYAQGQWSPDRWIVEAGLRLDGWSPEVGPAMAVWQPRFAVKRFVGSGDQAIRFAVGRYAQFVHSLRDEDLPLGIDIWVLAGARAPQVVSDQLQLGVEGYIGEEWYAGAESYVRRFTGVTTFNPADDPNVATDDLLAGTGLSYGADLQLRREQGRIRPMVAVSWLRAVREFDDVFAGTVPPPRLRYAPLFDRRLNVEFVLQAMLPRQLEGGLRWSLGTGLPYTRPVAAYVYYEYDLEDGAWRWQDGARDTATSAVILGPRNAERYPAYHRLDVSLRRTYRTGWGTVTPHFDVVNVYNRRNVLFYFYQYNRHPPIRSGISMFPLLPTVGVEVSF